MMTKKFLEESSISLMSCSGWPSTSRRSASAPSKQRRACQDRDCAARTEPAILHAGRQLFLNLVDFRVHVARQQHEFASLPRAVRGGGKFMPPPKLIN